jgi:hypothetical protein
MEEAVPFGYLRRSSPFQAKGRCIMAASRVIGGNRIAETPEPQLAQTDHPQTSGSMETSPRHVTCRGGFTFSPGRTISRTACRIAGRGQQQINRIRARSSSRSKCMCIAFAGTRLAVRRPTLKTKKNWSAVAFTASGVHHEFHHREFASRGAPRAAVNTTLVHRPEVGMK